jgi:hypothetical protein
MRRKWSAKAGGFSYDGETLSECQCPGSVRCTCGKNGDVGMVKGIVFHLTPDLVDELKHVFDDLWEVWPRVDEIHKYNSDWKQTLKDFDMGNVRYEARYEFDGSTKFLVIQIDNDHNVHLVVMETER